MKTFKEFLNENRLLKMSKLSSAEYQKAKKLAGFNKDDWEWDSKEELYVKKVNETKNSVEIKMFLDHLRRDSSVKSKDDVLDRLQMEYGLERDAAERMLKNYSR